VKKPATKKSQTPQKQGGLTNWKENCAKYKKETWGKSTGKGTAAKKGVAREYLGGDYRAGTTFYDSLRSQNSKKKQVSRGGKSRDRHFRVPAEGKRGRQLRERDSPGSHRQDQENQGSEGVTRSRLRGLKAEGCFGGSTRPSKREWMGKEGVPTCFERGITVRNGVTQVSTEGFTEGGKGLGWAVAGRT